MLTNIKQSLKRKWDYIIIIFNLKWVLGKIIHGFHGESSTFKRIQCNYGVGG
jgi:hypothetical protein